MQGHAVELLWVKVQDLAKGCEANEARRECWNFLEAVIRGQFEQLDIMRAEFFRLIKCGGRIECAESLPQRIQMLDALTQGNLLKGIDKKTIRRKGIEPIKIPGG